MALKPRTIAISCLALVIMLSFILYGLKNREREPESTSDAVATTEQNGSESTFDTGTRATIPDRIVVEAPRPNAMIDAPLTVTGHARGNWLFEASAPMHLYDADGKEIGASYIESTESWMTTEFIPFQGTMTYSSPREQAGMLVMNNDNPSGLPEHFRTLRIPVRIPDTQTTKIFVYWIARPIPPDPFLDCTVTEAVERIVPRTEGIARVALEELLKGPTPDEQNTFGFITNIPSGVRFQSLRIEKGTALVDFNANLEEGGGSCRTASIVTQITKTLKQFPTVTDVIISIDGRTKDILQP